MQKQIFVLPTNHQSAAGFITIRPNFNRRQFAQINILLPSVCQWESAHNSLQIKKILSAASQINRKCGRITQSHISLVMDRASPSFLLHFHVWFLFPRNVSPIQWWWSWPPRSVYADTHAAHSAAPASWVQQRSQLRFWLVHLYPHQWELIWINSCEELRLLNVNDSAG